MRGVISSEIAPVQCCYIADYIQPKAWYGALNKIFRKHLNEAIVYETQAHPLIITPRVVAK